MGGMNGSMGGMTGLFQDTRRGVSGGYGSCSVYGTLRPGSKGSAAGPGVVAGPRIGPAGSNAITGDHLPVSKIWAHPSRDIARDHCAVVIA